MTRDVDSLPNPSEREPDDDDDPPCECRQIDVDRFDAYGCPMHGQDGPIARRQRQQEADDEFAFWNGGKSDDDIPEECPF